MPEESLQSLAISKPAGGNNEKIFHVYDTKTGNDLLRFHVRRDHPPQDGYYFNFHYHRFDDGYLDIMSWEIFIEYECAAKWF